MYKSDRELNMYQRDMELNGKSTSISELANDVFTSGVRYSVRGIRTSFFHFFASHVGELKDVSTYPDLFAELLSRGWTRSDLEKLAFHNFYRVLKAAEQVIKLTVTTDCPGASPVSQFGLAVRR